MIVTVIIATHQGRRFMVRCLDALAKTQLPEGDSLQTIVVDNGSTDGTEELIRKKYPHVDLLVDKKPLGFSRANNAARKVARGDVVVFLNNDTEVTPSWLQAPLGLLRSDSKIAAVGSQLLFMHRFLKVTFRSNSRSQIKVSESFFRSTLDSKVRWAPSIPSSTQHKGSNVRVLQDGDAFYLPYPIPGIDPEEFTPPVISVLAMSSGTKKAPSGHFEIDNLSTKAISGVGAVSLPYSKESYRTVLIQGAGGVLTRDGDGGDFGACLEEGSPKSLEAAIVPTLCGAALICRRQALDAVNWFPTDYHVYYEDTHLCLKLSERGLLVYCPDSKILHYHTGTNKEFSPFFIENVTRSRLIFAAHFGTPWLLARRIKDQMVYSMDGWKHTPGRTALGKFRNSPSWKGFFGAIPVVARVVSTRLLKTQMTARKSRLKHLCVDRIPYPEFSKKDSLHETERFGNAS